MQTKYSRQILEEVNQRHAEFLKIEEGIVEIRNMMVDIMGLIQEQVILCVVSQNGNLE